MSGENAKSVRMGARREGISAMSLIQQPNSGTQRARVRSRPARLPVKVRLKGPPGSGNGAAVAIGAPRAKDAIPPFKMPRIRAPRFPKRSFDIGEFGAVPDDKFDCTHAIN